MSTTAKTDNVVRWAVSYLNEFAQYDKTELARHLRINKAWREMGADQRLLFDGREDFRFAVLYGMSREQRDSATQYA